MTLRVFAAVTTLMRGSGGAGVAYAITLAIPRSIYLFGSEMLGGLVCKPASLSDANACRHTPSSRQRRATARAVSIPSRAIADGSGTRFSARDQPAHTRRRPIPGRQSALNLATARLRHIADTASSSKRCPNKGPADESAITA